MAAAESKTTDTASSEDQRQEKPVQSTVSDERSLKAGMEKNSSSSKIESDKKEEDDQPSTPKKIPRETKGKQSTASEKGTAGGKGGQDTTPVTKKGSKTKKGRKKKQNKLTDGSAGREHKPQSPMMKRLTDFFPIRRSNRRCKSTIEAEEKKYLEDAIRTGKEEGLEVKEIEGKGRGVIAQKTFKKGQFVVEYHGDLIDLGTAKELEEEYGKDPSVGCYMYYFEFKNKRYCVDATKESGRLGRLLNHSKSGNCCTKLIAIQDKPHLILVAKRDIKVGEELLYDYGDRSKDTLESHPWLAL